MLQGTQDRRQTSDKPGQREPNQKHNRQGKRTESIFTESWRGAQHEGFETDQHDTLSASSLFYLCSHKINDLTRTL